MNFKEKRISASLWQYLVPIIKQSLFRFILKLRNSGDNIFHGLELLHICKMYTTTTPIDSKSKRNKSNQKDAYNTLKNRITLYPTFSWCAESIPKGNQKLVRKITHQKANVSWVLCLYRCSPTHTK